jgi:SAM-dependent methyltransferase
VSVNDRATSFDRVALEYERGRSGWPAELLDLLPVSDDAAVLDLGAGTGKLTRVLAERYARVIAVEPLAEMRAILAARVKRADVRDGRAEAIPLEDAAVDAVFAGQAFHWFANDVAVAEIARVLGPGGVLALLWNVPADPSPLPVAYEQRLSELRAAAPEVSSDEHLLDQGPFGERHEESVMHEQVRNRDEVLALAASASWIASRDDREQVLAELAAMLQAGEYVFPMRTEMTWAIRT